MATLSSDPGPAEGQDPIVWHEITFRSWTELRLARAFDATGILVFPNARCRVGIGPRRQTRELDFLANIDGWWLGIEVDGEPWHPPERAAFEHERDRLFLRQGLLIQRYDAGAVYADPQGTVAEIVAYVQEYRRSIGR